MLHIFSRHFQFRACVAESGVKDIFEKIDKLIDIVAYFFIYFWRLQPGPNSYCHKHGANHANRQRSGNLIGNL